MEDKQQDRSTWALRFGRNVLLWLIPAAVVWTALTPFYNRFLTVSAENLLHLTESPNMTRLLPHQSDPVHRIVASRSDLPPSRSGQVRVTDIHFNLVMTAALFLAVPGVPWRRRLGNLGLATLAAVFFHIVLLFFWVEFIYATQLGDWSNAHYGALAQNAIGLTKHLLDLPFKFALPLLLWAGFYLRELLPRRDEA